jgi:hypothetical protein
MKNSAVALDIALNALGNVRLQGTLRVRDVNKLRDVIETYPGSPATSFDMTGVTDVDDGAAQALKAALDGIGGGTGPGFSIRVCAGKLADALRSAGFGGAGRYHLSVREC